VLNVRMSWIWVLITGLFILTTGCLAKPPQPDQETVTLYFGDKRSGYLVQENRRIQVGPEGLETRLVMELIKGPSSPGRVSTIPGKVKIRSPVAVKDGIATVDFDREIKTGHWGGSAGEILTVYSVVNTLTELEHVRAVRFLVEGEEVDTLLGHLYLGEPVQRDESLIISR